MNLLNDFKFKFILASICFLVSCSVALAENDRWYALFLGGQQVGHSNYSFSDFDKISELKTKTKLSMRRGSVGIDVLTSTTWQVDSTSGVPIFMRTESSLGESKTIKIWEFKNRNEFIQIVENGTSTSKTVYQIEDNSWLTPIEEEKYIKARLSGGAKVIKYKTLNPEISVSPIEIILTKSSKDKMQILGKPIEVHKFDQEIIGFPLKGSVVVDQSGKTVSSSTFTGMGEMKMLLVEKLKALSKIEAPELLFSLMVETNMKTKKLRQKDAVTYVLTSPGISQLPSCGHQTVTKNGNDFLVTVNMKKLVEGFTTNTAIKSTVLADHKHPEIEKLHGIFCLSAPQNALDRVRSLEKFVYDWITKKDYSRAFATAAETAVDRVGDCTEHATLLGALLHADEIPSRAAIGLVGIGSYAEATFGWHLWTQAYIDGKWIDLDATRPNSSIPDHILMSTAPFEFDGMNKSMLEVINVIGDLKIKVVEPS